MEDDKIWCFWEPRNDIHGYLKLCLKTWQSLGREIIILDDSNLSNYLSKKELELLSKNRNYYSLPQYADAVRVMILHRYGGIWMDLDTIIINSDKFSRIEQLKKTTDLLALDHHIGWLWASRDSGVIDAWYRKLLKKLDFPKWQKERDGLLKKNFRIVKLIKYTIFREADKIKRMTDYIQSAQIDWDYLGNSIVDDLFLKAKPNEYRSLTELLPYDHYILESMNRKKTVSADNKIENYQNFWFSTHRGTYEPEDSILVCLHNSWTPEKYQHMKEEDFLHSSVRMAKLFKRVL